MRSLLLTVALAASLASDCAAQTAEHAGVDLAALASRARPSAGHELLANLVGEWEVEKSMYVVLGSPETPVRSSRMRTRREWIGDGRFVRDVTEGLMADQPYFRTGLLGFNNMDQRFEWVTADNVTPTMMIYLGRPGSGPYGPIVMEGSFTDLGVTGERSVGKSIPMRTVITIDSPDRHTLEIYFTPQAIDRPPLDVAADARDLQAGLIDLLLGVAAPVDHDGPVTEAVDLLIEAPRHRAPRQFL